MRMNENPIITKGVGPFIEKFNSRTDLVQSQFLGDKVYNVRYHLEPGTDYYVNSAELHRGEHYGIVGVYITKENDNQKKQQALAVMLGELDDDNNLTGLINNEFSAFPTVGDYRVRYTVDKENGNLACLTDVYKIQENHEQERVADHEIASLQLGAMGFPDKVDWVSTYMGYLLGRVIPPNEMVGKDAGTIIFEDYPQLTAVDIQNRPLVAAA